MTKLTSAASTRWESYLAQIRRNLSHLDRVEVSEIEENLESHLDTEIENIEAQVTESKIQAIIDQLGKPEELAAAFGIDQPSRAAPAATDQALTFSGLVLLTLSLFYPLVLIATIPASVTLARMALDRPEVLDSHYRMACYPVLLVGYSLLSLVVLFWPLLTVLPLAANGGILYGLFGPTGGSDPVATSHYWIRIWSVWFAVTGLWWLALAGLSSKLKHHLPRIFYPFVKTDQSAVRSVLLAGALVQLAVSIGVLILT